MQDDSAGVKQQQLESRSFRIRKSQRTTIYFEPAIHKKLKIKAVKTGQSVSTLVNETVRMALDSMIPDQFPPTIQGVHEAPAAYSTLDARVKRLESALRINQATISAPVDSFPSLQNLKQTLLNCSAELKNMRVKSLWVFGSFAKGEVVPGSDIDVLVEFDKPAGFFQLLELKEYLENLLESSIDLTTPDALRPEMKDQVLREAIRAV